MLAVLASAAAGQVTPTEWARPGDTVKVWAATPPLRGHLAVVRRSTPDTVYFGVRSAVAREWLETPVTQSQITRLDIRDAPGRSASRILLGAATGLVIGGAAVGGVVYFTHDVTCRKDPIACDTDEFSPEFGRAASTAVAATVGAMAGAIVGGLIGSRLVAQWRRAFP